VGSSIRGLLAAVGEQVERHSGRPQSKTLNDCHAVGHRMAVKLIEVQFRRFEPNHKSVFACGMCETVTSCSPRGCHLARCPELPVHLSVSMWQAAHTLDRPSSRAPHSDDISIYPDVSVHDQAREGVK